jgi:galactoside O-acetyltransferase
MKDEDLRSFGFKFIGKNVRISNKASIYNPSNISINDNSRIDDFCILSAGAGGIYIGKHVHIGCYTSLIGEESIIFEDFVGISGRVSIYSSSDDYSGNYMTNPTIPEVYRSVKHGKVILRRHAIVGAGSVILPDVEIGVGAAIGGLSFVRKSCEDFGVYFGCPAERIKRRKRKLLELEENLRKSQSN